MRKISSFTIVSLDGFFAGPGGEIDWIGGNDEEDRAFSAERSKTSEVLLFGRTTYGMMSQYWPTPEAVRQEPETARVLNGTPKVVFSKTMKAVPDGPVWKNVRVVREITHETVGALKEEGDGMMTVLGSGTVVRQLMNLGLIDELSLTVVPVVLGAGKPLFRDINRTNFRLIETREFGNGKVFLRYGKR